MWTTPCHLLIANNIVHNKQEPLLTGNIVLIFIFINKKIINIQKLQFCEYIAKMASFLPQQKKCHNFGFDRRFSSSRFHSQLLGPSMCYKLSSFSDNWKFIYLVFLTFLSTFSAIKMYKKDQKYLMSKFSSHVKI